VNLAYYSQATANPNEYSAFLVAKAQNSNNADEVKGITGFVLSTPAVSKSIKAYSCRLMAAGPSSNRLTLSEKLLWAKAAASYEPLEEINWYFVAAAASQLQDAQTEFSALINLSGLMIKGEIWKNQPDYQKLSNASGYLARAITLANYISVQQGQPYDSRMPYVMLVELGVYLPLNYAKDIMMDQYAQSLSNIDNFVNVKDELHLRVLGALAGANLYFAIQNATFFAQTGNQGYLFEKRNRAVRCINTAHFGIGELGQFYPGLANNSMYQHMYFDYILKAGLYNN